MTIDLTSFSAPLRAVVIGASGGIGGALTHLLEEHAAIGALYALSRSGATSSFTKAQSGRLDLLSEESIAAAAARISGPVDLVIVATGHLHDADGGPEKTWRSFAPERALLSYQVNAIGPMLVAKHFLPKLRSKAKSGFAAISARVGSISDNQSGGWYSYRAAKAALNQMIRTAAIELARKNPEAFCIGLHPGTVDTALSKPFQGNVPDTRLFTADQSARALLAVLNATSASASGRCFAWDGSEIAP